MYKIAQEGKKIRTTITDRMFTQLIEMNEKMCNFFFNSSALTRRLAKLNIKIIKSKKKRIKNKFCSYIGDANTSA